MNGIPWADKSWNPVTGCSPVSPGCKNCYAARIARRFKVDFTPTFHPDRLDQPLHWRKPRRIFVCSMADLFHPRLPAAATGRVFGTMAEAHWHAFMVLTKRALSLLEYSAHVMHYPHGDRSQRPTPGWPSNVWVGVTAEDQASADERVPLLIDTPAAHRWVCVEPMLEPIGLALWLPRLDWVVVGGENGPSARECHREWIEDVVAQCHAYGVPVYVKGMGHGRDNEGLPREYPAAMQ